MSIRTLTATTLLAGAAGGFAGAPVRVRRHALR